MKLFTLLLLLPLVIYRGRKVPLSRVNFGTFLADMSSGFLSGTVIVDKFLVYASMQEVLRSDVNLLICKD